MAARVGFFFDAQNCYRNARRAFFEDAGPAQLGQFWPASLAQLVVGRKSAAHDVTAIHAYRGRPDQHRDPRGHSANVRQSQAWVRSGVTVHPRQLRYPADGSPPQEKGVDVHLAVDLVSMSLRDEIDVAVVGSGDSDLVPAVEEVLAQTSVRVELLGWRGDGFGQALSVSGRRLWVNWVSLADYELIRDDTDYSVA